MPIPAGQLYPERPVSQTQIFRNRILRSGRWRSSLAGQERSSTHMQQWGFITLERPMELLRLSLLFAITALAEIIGCYLPWLVLRQGKPLYLLIPAAASLALFAWLLTLHPTAAGRTYAAYGGMYIAVALLWLKFVDGVLLTRWDALGATIALIGMAVIALQPATT